MAGKNILSVIAQAKDESSGPIGRVAKAYEAAQKKAAEADRILGDAAKSKGLILAKISADSVRFAAIESRISEERSRLVADEIKRQKDLEAAHASFTDKMRDRFPEFLKMEASAGGVAKGLGAVAGAAVAVGTAVLAAGAGIFALTKQAADAADAAGEMADKAGVSVEFLTRMGYAADLTGTNVETVRKGVQNLSKSAVDGSKAFERHGISLRDNNGHLKTGEQLFTEAANKIRGLESSTLRVAAAQDLFGKSGKELLPMLTDAGMSLDDFSAKADELGVTITAAEVAVGSRFTDALANLEKGLAGAARAASSQFAPVITIAMEKAAEVVKALNTAVGDNKTGLQMLARDGMIVAARSAYLLTGAMGFVVDSVDRARIAMLELSLESNERQNKRPWRTDSMIEGLQKRIDLEKKELAGLKASAAARRTALETGLSGLDELEHQLSKITPGTIAAEEAEGRLDAAVGKLGVTSGKSAGETRDLTKARKEHLDLEEKIEAAMIRAAAKQEEHIAAITAGYNAQATARMAFASEGGGVFDENKYNAGAEKREAADNKRIASEKKRDEEAFQSASARMEKAQNEAEGSARRIYGAFRGAFNDALASGKGFGDALIQLFTDLAVRALESGIIKLIGSLFTGGVGGAAGGVLSFLGFEKGGLVPRAEVAAPKVVRMAGGGLLSGGTPGVDSIPVLAQEGEGFLSRGLTKQLRNALAVPQGSNTPSAGGSAGFTLVYSPSFNTPSLPDQALADRFHRDSLIPSLKRLHAAGALNFLKR